VTKLIKLIHPKTGTVREVPEDYANKIALLKRANFIPFENYRAPKKKVVVPDPTVLDGVKEHKQDAVDPEGVEKPVTAIHASGAARRLIKENDLDPALIEGTGKDGQITKPDVEAHLEALEESEKELPEQPVERAATEEEEKEEEELAETEGGLDEEDQADPPAEEEEAE